jgi:DNA-binding NtrC family response regulator
VWKVSYKVKHVDRLSKGLECLGSDNAAVVLLDLDFPDAAGLDLIEKIHAPAPDVSLVVLTRHEDDEVGIKAVQKGAQDYFVNDRVTGSLLGHSIH